MNTTKVLFLVTSQDQFGSTSYRTGVWLEELAVPYYQLKEADFEIVISSPKGGTVPLDPKSESIIMATQSTKRFLKDQEAMDLIADSIPVHELNIAGFDAVLVPGGHGCIWDLCDNDLVKGILETFNEDNKPIATLGHGVVALFSVRGADGKLLIAGRHLTGTSNNEDESAGTAKTLPYLAENQINLLGGLYTKGANYLSHVVVDGNIISGQNAASSAEVVSQMILQVRHAQEIELEDPLPIV